MGEIQQVPDNQLPIRRQVNFGWRPDTPDQRDRQFNHLKAIKRLGKKGIPSHVDLRTSGFLPPTPYDQGDLGSCTANAIGAAYRYQQCKQGLEAYDPSRLFIYYGEREIEGTIEADSGAEIRDGMKVLSKLGAPHEVMWPYEIGRFTQRPSDQAYQDAVKHNCLAYESVEVKTTAVKAALAAGHPVVVGFSVYSSFWQIEKNGLMPTPKPKENLEGGHAVLVVGYQQMVPFEGGTHKRDHAIILNSWGSGWGDRGYFYMPLAWLCDRNNADDFWAVTITES